MSIDLKSNLYQQILYSTNW